MLSISRPSQKETDPALTPSPFFPYPISTRKTSQGSSGGSGSDRSQTRALMGPRLNPEPSSTSLGPQTHRRAANSILRPRESLQRENYGASTKCQGQQEPGHRHLPGGRQHPGPRPSPAPPNGGADTSPLLLLSPLPLGRRGENLSPASRVPALASLCTLSPGSSDSRLSPSQSAFVLALGSQPAVPAPPCPSHQRQAWEPAALD